MAEFKVLKNAQILKGDEVVYDLAKHGRVAVRLVTQLDEREIAVIVPMPKRAPEWVPRLLAFTFEEAVRKVGADG